MQPLRVRDAHATELGFPTVEGRCTDARLPADVGGRASAFLLFEDADDLLPDESTCLHLFALWLAQFSIWSCVGVIEVGVAQGALVAFW